MEKERPKKRELFEKYTDEQLELFRILVKDIKCSTPTVHELTGIPHGSMPMLCDKLGIKMPSVAFGGTDNKGNILRARTLFIARRDYGERLRKAFGPVEK